jgi:AcrR family transcriptional regulator
MARSRLHVIATNLKHKIWRGLDRKWAKNLRCTIVHRIATELQQGNAGAETRIRVYGKNKPGKEIDASRESQDCCDLGKRDGAGKSVARKRAVQEFITARRFSLAQGGGNFGMTTAMKVQQKRRNRKAREQALLAAAAKLFASGGYDLTTTRAIASRAGCAEGLIHRYFHGKAGLLFAMIQARVSKEVESLSERVRQAPTLEQEFLQLVDWEVDRIWEDRDFLRVIVPRALLDRGHSRLLSRVGTSRHVGAIVERLKRFPECQGLPEEEIEGLAEFVTVLGMMYGFIQPMVLRRDRSGARKTAATVARILARRL